ncbi:MAG: hypothetical protein H5U22_02435 [Rhizobium sp.]|nr:hypothetical protein [Rhizobium sp.]
MSHEDSCLECRRAVAVGGLGLADCAYHNTSAAADVDRQMTTASIVPDEQAAKETVLLKQSRLPAEEKPVSE